MIYATYKDLVVRFGNDNAHQLMRTIERVAQGNKTVIPLDQEQRFCLALEALNDNSNDNNFSDNRDKTWLI
jgi:phage gp36-like protein